MRLRSLSARLIAGTCAWLVVALTTGGFALSYAFRRSVEIAFEERLESLLFALIAALEVRPDGSVHMARAIPDPRFERVYSGWYWQVGDGAEPLLRSRSLWDAVLPFAGEAVASRAGRALLREGPREERLRVVERSLRFPSRPGLLVAVAGPEAEIREEVAGFHRLLVMSLGGLGTGLALAVVVQVAYGLRPLRRLADELEEVRRGRAAALGADYPREIQPLARAIDDVLDQDTQRIERARTHVGNLAHALKTPLAILSAEAAAGPPEHAPRIVEQVKIMTRLVDHHLTRAAAAGSSRRIGARTEIGAVVEDLRTTLGRLHAERSVAVDIDLAPGAAFAGERQDLEEMLGNLMDNACRFAASRVSIRAMCDGGRLRVEIDDDGPGLDAAETEHALRRGARLHDDRLGARLVDRGGSRRSLRREALARAERPRRSPGSDRAARRVSARERHRPLPHGICLRRLRAFPQPDAQALPLFAFRVDFKVTIAAAAVPHLAGGILRAVQLRRDIHDGALLGTDCSFDGRRLLLLDREATTARAGVLDRDRGPK